MPSCGQDDKIPLSVRALDSGCMVGNPSITFEAGPGKIERSDSYRIRRNPDGMRRPVSERDAVRSQVMDVLKAQEIKETGNEEG
jgi:hypothetical protein